MKSRIAALVLTFVFISVPVFAQGPPGGTLGRGVIESLQRQIDALSARVSKLEGNIVASDLAGTYSLTGIETNMSPFVAGTSPRNATISILAFRGTMTLNAGGTGSVTALSCEGSTLTQGPWSLGASDCSGPDETLTWTYADGVITLTFLSDGDVIPFNVALGGRLLIQAFAPFHPSDPSSQQDLLIFTRLR